MIPIISLRKKFGMPDKEYDNQTRIVVVDVSGETVGMVVDGVSEVLRVPAGSLEEAPKLVSGGNGLSDTNYIKSVVKLEQRMLIYLDLENIISSSELSIA